MRIRKIFALIVLLSSFVFTSCMEKDNLTGSELLPDDYFLRLYKTEFDIPVQMKLSDNLQTAQPGYAIIGSINDPDFGMVQSETAFSFVPQDTSRSYGTNPIPKSLHMYIYGINNPSYVSSMPVAYSDNDLYIHQNIYVHRLKSEIDSINTIYNNSFDTDDYEATPLNVGGGNVFFGNNPNLQINLPLSLAEELLSATKAERSDIYKFMKRYQGFYLKTDPVPTSYIGGRLCYISMSSEIPVVGLSLTYWHTDSKIPEGKDSTITYWANPNKNINIISHESSHLEDSDPAGNILLEGFAGIKPYVDFNEVKTSIDTWAVNNQIDLTKLIVSKAELQLYYDAPDDYIFMQNFYPPFIYLNTQEQDDNNKFRYMPQTAIFAYLPSQEQQLSNWNTSKEMYSLDISSYIQNLIQGKLTEEDKKAWVMANYPVTNPNTGAPMGYSIDNVTFQKVAFFGKNSVKKPRLILTYALMQ